MPTPGEKSGLRQRFLQYRTYARLTPFDTSSPEGRDQERLRRIALSAVASGLSQILTYVSMFLLVPMLLRHLGEERYGIWLMLESFILALAFADLGLGNGLINAIGKAHGRSSQALASQYIACALMLLTGVALILGLICWWVLPLANWEVLIQLRSQDTARELMPTMAIFAGLVLLNLPLSVVEKIQIGYQESYINSFYRAAAKGLVLAGVWIAAAAGAGLPTLVALLMGIPVGTVVANALHLFGWRRPGIRPRWRYLSAKPLIELLRSGLLFFVTGISGTLAYQLDSLVIAHFLGAGAVPTYGLPLKLFTIAGVMTGFILQPIWPAYREALIRGDLPWVKRTYFRSLKLSLIVTIPPSCILLFFCPWLIQTWTGAELAMPRSLLAGLTIFACMTAVTGPMAMLLNGANILGARAVASLAYGVTNLGLSIWLVQRIGIAGPVWGTVLAQILISWPVSIYYVSRVLSGSAAPGERETEEPPPI